MPTTTPGTDREGEEVGSREFSTIPTQPMTVPPIPLPPVGCSKASQRTRSTPGDVYKNPRRCAPDPRCLWRPPGRPDLSGRLCKEVGGDALGVRGVEPQRWPEAGRRPAAGRLYTHARAHTTHVRAHIHTHHDTYTHHQTVHTSVVSVRLYVRTPPPPPGPRPAVFFFFRSCRLSWFCFVVVLFCFRS